jgi:hypothetical protein
VVRPINDAPAADHLTLETDEDTPLPLLLTGSDVDGDTLTFVVTVPPQHGVLSGDAPELTYTPDADFHGEDGFVFTVSDGIADPVEGTVSIVVHEVGGTPFEEWAAAYDCDPDPDADCDGDSLSNAIEYVLGGDPLLRMDADLLPRAEVILSHFDEGDSAVGKLTHLCFSYRLSHRARRDALTEVAVEWSTDPAGPWALACGSNDEFQQIEVQAAFPDVDLIQVFIPAVPEAEKLFARLRVTIMPAPQTADPEG